MIRTVIVVLTAVLFAFAVAAQGRPMAPLPFLIGADWPVDASEAVEKQAADMGINFARINGGGGAWSVESHSKKCKQLEERNIHVLLQLGSHWVPANYFKFTDYFFFDHAGRTGKEDRTSWSIKTGGNDWPQFSYAAAGEDFKKELYEEYANYTAAMRDRANVIGVIVHNEPGLFWQDDKLYDYNPRTIERFRQWLTVRHETVDALNQRWGSGFKSFGDVSPPAKLPPISDPAELAAMIDWRRFHTEVIENWLRWEIVAAMNIQPRITWRLTTNLAGPLDNWHFYRCDDMYRFSKGKDAVGVDIYSEPWTGKLFGDYTVAMARGVAATKSPGMTSPWIRGDRPVWVLEAQTYDDRYKDLTPEQRGDLLYRDLWTYAAGGAKAIALWRLSDTGGHSLTHGEANPRTAAVKTFAAQAKWLGLERFNPEPATTAVVVDPDSLRYVGATSEKLTRTSGIHQNFQGFYAAVRSLGLDADVIFQDQLRDEPIRHKTLILPSTFMMDEELAGLLKKHVETGGVLIVDEGFASLDRFGKPLTDRDGKPLSSPGFGLDKVVGDGPQEVDKIKGVTFGKGRGAMWPKNRGQGFLEGWASQPFASFVPDQLSKVDRVLVFALQTGESASSASAISTRLGDDRGNTLIVLTQPNEKMKPLVAETGLKVVVPNVPKAPKRVVLLHPDNADDAMLFKHAWKNNTLTVDVDVTSACAIAFGDNLPE